MVGRDEWLRARRELLAREKEHTRRGDELAAARRALPWMRIEKPYAFDGPDGRRTLPELFAGKSQLVMYHFMFDPAWDAGCPHCSFWADGFDRVPVHLAHRDVTFVAVSRAPRDKLVAYARRMGWSFPWYSSYPSDFNYDLGVAFRPEELAAGHAQYNFVDTDPGETEREGVSCFYRDGDGKVFRTYSAYARGIDLLNPAYAFLDLAPKGRDEGGQGQFWVRRRDEYER